jgi:hypothetical protein
LRVKLQCLKDLDNNYVAPREVCISAAHTLEQWFGEIDFLLVGAAEAARDGNRSLSMQAFKAALKSIKMLTETLNHLQDISRSYGTNN